MFGRVVHQFTYFNIVFINMYMDTLNDNTDRQVLLGIKSK